MRTNIDIDDDLMSAALEASGAATKKAVVAEGLELLVRMGRQREIRALRGRLRWDGDLEASRLDA